MPTFKDNKDREWEVNIDAPSIMRIRAECDPRFLLNDGAQDNTYLRLDGDPVLLCRVVYLLCAKQRSERSVTEEDFYLHVIGNAIDGATEAMLAAIVNFTPAKTRDLLSAVANKTSRIQSQAMALAMEKINDPQIEQQIMAELTERLNQNVQDILTRRRIATPSPDSSESTPPV